MLQLVGLIERDAPSAARTLGLAKPEYINFVADDLLRTSRLHLLVESQFQIETLFCSLLRALGQSPSRGYKAVAMAMIAQAGIADPDSKFRRLYVPAKLRNSMHANGIHHDPKDPSSLEIINGVEFRFDHGRKVSCASWYHITAALTEVINIVDELSAAPVKALGLVEDEYSRQSTGHP